MAKPILTTPFGTAKYPSVNTPDIYGEFASGKYKISLTLSKEDLAKFKADFTTAVGPVPKGHKLPWREKDGELIITAKTKFAPAIIDMQKKPVEFDEGEYLAGGSTVRIAVEPFAYKGGHSLVLKSVQVRQLVTGAAGGAAYFNDDDAEDSTVETEDALDI